MAAFKPMSATAKRIVDDAIERAEVVVRVAYPGAKVWRVIWDEHIHPVVLFSVCAVDGFAEAAKAVMHTSLDAEEPAFTVSSGWDVDDDY